MDDLLAGPIRLSPTLDEVQKKWQVDLQLLALHIVAQAKKSTRAEMYLAVLLGVIAEDYQPAERAYVFQFVRQLVDAGGLTEK
jgi:hypothetical protein